MKLKLLCSVFICFQVLCYSQNVSLKIAPFVNATTSVKDGLVEAGPEFNWEKIEKGTNLILRPTFRMPLTNNADNVLQIDRFSSTWKSMLVVQYIKDNTQASGSIKRHSLAGQFEYGYYNFKYYPMGNQGSMEEAGKNSYAFEVKYVGYFTKGAAEAKQFSPQFRLRYAYNWKAAGEVGVVNLPNSNGVVTTTNMTIDAPYVNPTFSPAFSLQVYPGKGTFSYSPTIYYDFTGKSGTNNPFGNVNRLRLECWVFFYPLVKDSPNVKIGVTPFVSIRTAGLDSFNKVEFGGMITIKFGTTFLQFL